MAYAILIGSLLFLLYRYIAWKIAACAVYTYLFDNDLFEDWEEQYKGITWRVVWYFLTGAGGRRE